MSTTPSDAKPVITVLPPPGEPPSMSGWQSGLTSASTTDQSMLSVSNTGALSTGGAASQEGRRSDSPESSRSLGLSNQPSPPRLLGSLSSPPRTTFPVSKAGPSRTPRKRSDSFRRKPKYESRLTQELDKMQRSAVTYLHENSTEAGLRLRKEVWDELYARILESTPTIVGLLSREISKTTLSEDGEWRVESSVRFLSEFERAYKVFYPDQWRQVERVFPVYHKISYCYSDTTVFSQTVSGIFRVNTETKASWWNPALSVDTDMNKDAPNPGRQEVSGDDRDSI